MLLVTPILVRTVGTEAAVILASRPLPAFAFITHLATAQARELLPPATPTRYALEVSDSSRSGYGEWFSDWNACAVSRRGSLFTFQFYYEITNVTSTTSPQRQTNFASASISADSVSDDILDRAESNNHQPH